MKQLLTISFLLLGVNVQAQTVVESADVASEAIDYRIKRIVRDTLATLPQKLTQNLKTINGQSLVGTGNISISGGGGSMDSGTFATNYRVDTSKSNLRQQISTKADAVPGKQLSTEDYTTSEKSKLSGIAPNATANSTDATLLNRANHTGTQPASTISDFTTVAAAAAPVQSVSGRTGAVTLTKTDVGLANVDNTSDLNKPVSTAQQSALDLKANLASPTFTGTVSGITKGMVGLGNVDNTSDANKPVSTAQQTALNGKASLTGATFTGAVTATNLSGTNTGDQTNIPGNAGTVTSIAGQVVAGTNMTRTGSGTTADPYVFNSTASGGGGGGTPTYIIGKKITTWYPLNSSSGTTIQTVDRGLVGTVGLVGGTASNFSGGNKSYATFTTRFNSYRYTSTAAASSLTGLGGSTSEATLFRGANANEGGFQCYFKFALTTLTSASNLILGLTTVQPYSSSGTIPSVDYSNALALVKDPSDNTLYIATNGGGTRTKTTTGATISSTSIYEFYITVAAGGSSVDYRLIENTAAGARTTVYTGTIGSTLPAATTYLFPVMALGTNTGTAAVVMHFYGAEFTSDN